MVFDRNTGALVLIMAAVGAILTPGGAAIANGGELDGLSLTASFCIGAIVGAGLGLASGLIYKRCGGSWSFWGRINQVVPESQVEPPAESCGGMRVEDV